MGAKNFAYHNCKKSSYSPPQSVECSYFFVTITHKKQDKSQQLSPKESQRIIVKNCIACVTLGGLLLPVSQFAHLQSGENHSAYRLGLGAGGTEEYGRVLRTVPSTGEHHYYDDYL